MASTLKAIIPLSEDTTKRLTRNRSEWLSFLNTAGRNYKYTFHEQVLIYAQKPDATACATLEFWNKSVRRWVNKYAEGIALIDDSHDKLRLRYVFDVSDTNGYYGNQPYIWKPEPRDAEPIMEALSNSFGEQEAPDLPAAMLATAKNAVLDNYGDYFTELLRVKNDSFLEEMDSLNVEVEFRQTLENSIAYMLLTRCGYDAAQYISAEDFPHITDFNTIPVISILGTASTGISRMVLREVERTVKALRREERKSGKKFAENQEVNYHKGIQKNTEIAATERSMEHEHHLQTDGRLQAAGADLAGGSAGHREVRTDAESVSEETQAGLLLGADDNRQTDGASGGNRTDGLQADGTADGGDGGKSRGDGGIEGTQSDGVGRLDEQYPAGGGGTNPARTDLRIEAEQGGDEVSSLPPFLSEDLISEILCYDKYLKADRAEMIRFFRDNPQADARGAYLKRIYNNDYTELLVLGGQRVGYKKQENGLCMWAGSYLTRTAESVFSWDVVQEQVASLIDRNLFFNAQPLPTLKSVAEQLSLFDFMNAEPHAELPAAPIRKAFSISQQVIDEVLASGGNDENSRLRICAYFKKNHRLGETAAFLQKEFGNDGKGFYIGQERITARYDEQGIRIAQGRTAIHAQESIVVSWEDAARRIHTLLDAGQYMPQGELDRVDEWERHDLATRIWDLYRDEFGNIPEDKKIITDLYPADKKADQLAQQLTDPKAVEAIANNISELIPLLEEYPPRFRIYHDPVEVYNAVTDLLLPQPVYKAMDGFTFAENRRYISDDEIDALLAGRGSGIAEGKFRIYSFFLTHDAEKEKTDFLKKEYGIGGYNDASSNEWHDGEGIAYSRGELGAPYDKILLPWNKVVKRIDKLIAENRYMSQHELASLPEYEKQMLCRSLYHFFAEQPEEVPRPFAFAAEYDTAVKTLRPQLDSREAVGAILKQMEAVLDNTADFDRHYPAMVKAYEDLAAYDAGTYSLFGRTEAVSPYPQEEPERDYDLGYGHLGNGLTVWDRSREENGDYVIVAHIAPDRTVTFYEKDLPDYIKDEIERVAATAEMNISTTQTAQVFSTPPTVERDHIDKFWIDADTQTLLWQYYVPINDSMGQYVYRYCSYDLVREAAQNSTNKEQFFGFLASLGDEEVIEYGEAEYAELEQGFLTNPADFWNCTDETMQGLLQEVGLEVPEKSGTEEPITAVEDDSQRKALAPDTAAEYIPINAAVEIDGRRFAIDSVDYAADSVSLRDITFQESAGFPIFRTESVNFVRSFVEEQLAAPTPPEPDAAEPVQYTTKTAAYYPGEKNHLPFDVEIRTLRTGDSLPPPAVTPPKAAQGQATPQAERINYRITDDALGVAGAKTRFQNNIAAIHALNQIELEKRLATAEEQEVLSKYTGWGALPQVFDENNTAWAKEFSELQALLSPEDYASARATTLNAHYTSPVVIRAMYQALENMGFSRGNILEPACGIGNFFGMLPDRMQESRLFGVELDGITGRIAKQLYQKSNITVSGFEETNLPDSFFDVAVGNVPFGSYKLTEKRYDKYNFLIHDHFFAKAIDKVRPGGVIAFITSKGTMDKQNPAVRKYIAQRADLIGAVRLPNTAFKANAGTEVTSDIIFLQKRDRIVDVEPEWVHIGQTETGIPVNQYFLDHPEMVLGEMAYSSRMYGNEKETTCNPIEGSDLAELLTAAIANLHAEISEVELDEALSEEEDRSIPADPTVRNFSYALVDGEIYFRENSIMLPAEVSVTAANRIRGMIAIRDSARQLIEYQAEEYPDSDIINERANLNKLYDSFTAQYGLLSSRANSLAFSQDSSYPLLCSLEIVDEHGNLKRKADMFYKRTIKPNISVERVDTASEALAVSLAERARVDMGFMSTLTGKDEETLAKELRGVIFLDFNWNSDGSYTYRTADDFLSGNVREKLKKYRQALEIMPEDAKHIDTIRANVDALEQVQPVDLKASEISVRLGSTWLPPDVPERFMYELLDTSWRARDKISVLYSQYTGEWNITGKSADRGNVKAENTYGTYRINAYKIIEETLNQRDVRIFDRIYDADGNERRVLNKKETAIAQAKQELIKQAFKDWIWKDASRRERLTTIYNERFNSLRPREYDGSHIRFSGINPEITLRKHQINAIAHIIYGGNTLLAHEVGAGKTFEMVAGAMESKRLGLCSKSMIVVPNHITEQFAAEWLQLYPAANILVATKKDFETQNRRKFCGRIATGDYDAVIIGHSQFEKIPVSVERQRRTLEYQIEELLLGIQEAKRANSENYTIKQMEKSRKTLEAKLKKLNDQNRKDNLVTFEELGVDRIFVDEAHYFKNLFLITKMRNVSGIAQTEAQKSSDLFMKCRYLDELTDYHGTVFATGTPISNSMVELYTLQRYLQYRDLQKAELQHFDAWASTFGETTTAIELAPEGYTLVGR